MEHEKLNRRLQIIANLGIVAGLVLVGVQLKQNSDLLKMQLLYMADIRTELATAKQESAPPEIAVDPKAPESAIRAARARFNSALEKQELEDMFDLFAPDYQLISGRGDRTQGPEAHLEMWRQTFTDDPTFNCQRTPEEISVNANWGLAREVGRWVCTQTVEGTPAKYTGVYAAKWQTTVNSHWVLQSEVFTTLSCDGPPAACRRPDPIP